MKVLVLGKEGQLSSSLASAAKPGGFEIFAVGRPEIDLAKPETIAPAFKRYKPDLVVNTAAYTAVDKAEQEPEIAQAINAQGAGLVAEACARISRPLIHISTDYVFDGTKLSPYCEDDPVAPLGVYGRTKLEGEQRVTAACREHIILRTSWVFSPYGHNFVKTMLRLAAVRSDISVVDDQIGSPTYASHLAISILKIAQLVLSGRRASDVWGIYHAAGSGEASWYDVAREVFLQSMRLGGPGATVHSIATSEFPTPAKRPENSRLDCSKLARAFNVCLPNWQEGISECVLLLSQDASDLSQQTGHRE